MATDEDPDIPPKASRAYRLAGALLFIVAAVAGISTIRACKPNSAHVADPTAPVTRPGQ